MNAECDGGCSRVLSGLRPHLYGQSSVFYICLFAVPPGHIHSLCLWSITSNSTCISSDTTLLQLPEYSLVFWRDLWKITTLFKGCYLTSDRSQSSRLSAWQTNGPVDNEKSSERPGAATFESRWVGEARQNSYCVVWRVRRDHGNGCGHKALKRESVGVTDATAWLQVTL